jgi:LytS/YehU family sensor histidine kinase
MTSIDMKSARINPAKRLAFTLVGLLAGDVMLLFFLLQHALHATVLAGGPARMIADAVQMFVLYAIFSFAGWLLVGLPTALIFPADSITRLSWPLALMVGIILGPPALVVIFGLLGRGHIYFRNVAETATLFAYSVLVSAIAFMVYLALLRKEMKRKPAPPQRTLHHV